jgi:hypothetical protein
MLVDTEKRLFYVGEAERLIQRFRQGHDAIPKWDYYRYDALRIAKVGLGHLEPGAMPWLYSVPSELSPAPRQGEFAARLKSSPSKFTNRGSAVLDPPGPEGIAGH